MEKHHNCGKKNAEKWTKKKVLPMLKKMLNATEGKYYLGMLLDDYGLYPHWWRYIGNKFEGDSEITELQKKIDQRLERNLAEAMLKGKVKETTGIFMLKAKHKWKDKQEVNHKFEPITINLNLNK